MEIFKIPITATLFIYTMPAPESNKNLNQELSFLYQNGVNLVVSLLSNPEIIDLNLENEAAICTENKINYMHFPINDFETPKDNKAFIEFGLKVKKELCQAKCIAIHCRAGIGRSSLFAALLLVLHDFDKQKVFKHISTHRKVLVPDTKEQIEWFYTLCEDLEKLKDIK